MDIDNKNEELNQEIDNKNEEMNKENNDKDEELNKEINEKSEDLNRKAENENLEELKILKNNLLIKAAEFDNMKKRLIKESEENLEYANKRIIVKFLDIIENLNRAILASKINKDFDALVKGLEMVMKQFQDALDTERVKAIDAYNKKFDPNLHHAILQEENDDFEDNTVLEELAKGYTLGDKVIKHTLVKVSKKQKDVKNG